jgi:cell division protein FtsB
MGWNEVKAREKGWRISDRGFCALVLLFGSVLMVLTGLLPNHRKLERLKTRKERLVQEILWLQKENERLCKEIAALRTDPWFIERVLRARFGFSRPEEIRLEPDRNTSPDRNASPD